MLVNAFDHVHIYAADPERSIAFYQTHLGAERVGALPAGDDRQNHLLILGGQFLVVSAFPAGLEPRAAPPVGDGAVRSGFGVAHLGLNVEDLDAVITRLESAGIDVHSAPRGSGALRYVYFTAPDGVIIELTRYVLPPRLAPAGLVLRTFNRAVHAAKRALAKGLVGAVGSKP